MSFTLSDLRTRVANNIDRDDVPDTAGGLIDRWINDAQRRVCRAHNFAFMEAHVTRDTSDETRAYSLPTAGDSDWTEIDSGTVLRYRAEINCELINSDSYRVPLTKKYKQDIEDDPRYRDTEGYGTPKCYSMQNGKLHLEPPPNHSSNSDEAWTIDFEYYGFLADLSSDSDNNDLTNNYPDVVEAFATSCAFRYVLEFDTGKAWERDGIDLVNEMVIEDNRNKHGNIEVGMQPRRGSGMYPNQRKGYITSDDPYD